jgi:hypothetical protein
MDHESDIRGISCDRAGQFLAAYSEERLKESRRLELQRHLVGCRECRAVGAAADPAIIFTSLGSQEAGTADPAFWTRFDAALRSRLEAEVERRHGPLEGLLEALRGVPRLAYAAPVLLAAILAGLVFLRPGALFHGPAGTSVEAIPSPYGAPATAAMRAAGALAEPNRRGGGNRLPTTADEIASLPTLEEVSSPGARVYRLDAFGGAVAAGTAADAAAVYFVVDESINF